MHVASAISYRLISECNSFKINRLYSLYLIMKSQISNMFFNVRKVAVALTLVTALGGCVKEKFDTPPVGGEDPKGCCRLTLLLCR
jgi:hypothetical protein